MRRRDREHRLLAALLVADAEGVTPSAVGMKATDPEFVDLIRSGWIRENRRRWFIRPGFELAIQQRAQALSPQPSFTPDLALVAQVPSPVNERVAKAVWFSDSKSGQELPDTFMTTHDEILRMRGAVPETLRFVDGIEVQTATAMAIAGELLLPERRVNMLSNLSLPVVQRLVTVENKGSYIEFMARAHDLVVFVPGWNMALATRFIQYLPETLPWSHFGDLDAEGVAIYRSLMEKMGRTIELLVPACPNDFERYWRQAPTGRGWPVGDDDHLWLEQEVLFHAELHSVIPAE